MALLAPTVVGPLSQCSPSVRVQGQMVGATVALFESGQAASIGGGVATAGDQVFPLNGGVTLAPGKTITAKQTQGATTSPASPGVVVQPKPATIGHVACSTHIYKCGQALWLSGMVPGATFTVKVGALLRGSGTSYDGTAQVSLTAPTGATDTLVVTQTACGTLGQPTNLPKPDPPPTIPTATGDQGVLPPVTIIGPVYACQSAITMSGIVDGALVTVTEVPAPGFSESAFVGGPAVTFLGAALGPPPDKVSAIQTMPGCKIEGTASTPTAVTASVPVPEPTVVGPLCAGAVNVTVKDLSPNNPVEIFQGATSVGTGTSIAPVQTFNVPALAANATITARQQLCNNWSGHPASKGVVVNPAPATIPKPVVASPLYQCGAAVHVSALNVGAAVIVHSTLLGGAAINGPTFATSAAMDIAVSPLLMAGDKIYATQQGCGHDTQSADVLVLALPSPIPTPTVVSPVGSGSSSVNVKNLVAGARVNVYINGVFRGSVVTTAATATVPVTAPLLTTGDKVTVDEVTCEGTIPGSEQPTPVTGCVCKQVSKVATKPAGTFQYTFRCTTPAGTTETRVVDATSDSDALSAAELECDKQYGA
jgi:hypothetical protein